MIHVHENYTALGLDKSDTNTLLLKVLGDSMKETILDVQITTDLTTLFTALFDKYGKSKTATIVESAMKTAVENEDGVEVRKEYDSDNPWERTNWDTTHITMY